MTAPEDDVRLDELAALPAHPPDDAVATRIHARARRAFEREAALARTPAVRRARHLYDRAIEPTLVAAAAVVYLAWALSRVLSLLG